MVWSRLHIMATLVPLLTRREGRVVMAYAARNPAAFLHLRSTTAVPPRTHSASSGSSSRDRAPDPSSTPSIFGRRRSRTVGHAGRGSPVASVQARSTSSGSLASTRGASAEGLTMEDARRALKSLFGHEDFRDGQEAVVAKLLEGESCAGVFPTGAGKSICYQLPGTLMARQGRGLTLVVSPLIALMKDQTDALTAAGVPCAKLDSTLEAHEVSEIYEEIRAGSIALLYVSPERFNNERFVSTLKGVKVALFVVDEAHCISEWGHNFRPDYLRLADFAKAAKASARLALTATATPKVAIDIADRLVIPSSNVKRTRFYRPMLSLGAVRAPDDPEERTLLLAEMLLAAQQQQQQQSGPMEGRGGAAVVYVTLQRTAEEVAEALVGAGLDARPYHAGLPPLQREETQDWFMNASDGSSPVVVGTIAFGMGLDKKNVRRVFHFNLPRSPEDLAQQVGRAGRDGDRATCTTLVSAADLPVLRSMIYGGTPSEGAVRGLLRAVFAGGDDEADFNFYDLSQVLDTKDLVLKTLIAHLQIRGLVKEKTSYFETADVQLLDAGRAILDEGTEEAIGDLPREWLALLGLVDTEVKRKRKNAKWATLKVDEVAQMLDVPKQQIARMLSGMSYQGLIAPGKPGKIRARFEVLRRPASYEQAQSLSRDLHSMAMELQDRELLRLDTVVKILCKQEGTAVSSGLSEYFGDSESTVAEAAANENAAAVPGRGALERPLLSDVLTPPQVSEAEFNERWRTGVFDLLVQPGGQTGEGSRVIPSDDAYLLARFAAGIRSPRIGKLKLTQLESFGCCADFPFPLLLSTAETTVAAAAAAARGGVI